MVQAVGHRSRESASGRRRERGAVLVEAAIIAPVFFVLLFAIFEGGFLYRDYLTASSAVADASRIGAIIGPEVIPVSTTDPVTADYEIVKALREGLSGVDSTSIERIVIFKTNGSGNGSAVSRVPNACKNGTPLANRCNVYNPNQAFLQVQAQNAAFFNCDTNPGGPACSWDPTSRRDGPDPTKIDYIGVYVSVVRDSLTGMFNETYTIREASIVRLEPGSST